MLAVLLPAGLLAGLLAAVPPPGVLVPSSAEPGIVIPPPVMVERELVGAPVAQYGKGFKLLPRGATRLRRSPPDRSALTLAPRFLLQNP
ncbi:MAG: hypothetical protein IPK80_17600 [Nannocystis sp.]|nr:hypothetical protein [Nannocystis sp.]